MSARPLPMRSFAKANHELALSFERYLIARGNPGPTTRRAYLGTVNRLVASLGPEHIVNVERYKIRELFTSWCESGISANSRRLHVCALRSFFKFIRLTGLTKHDPMILISAPKTPTRLPRVLTPAEVEALIAATKDDPFQEAVVELLYSTGVRVSELCKLRLEDIHWNADAPHAIRVIRGKGAKDRIVLFGSRAAKAIRKLQTWRPSKNGFLLESPGYDGVTVDRTHKRWMGTFVMDEWRNACLQTRDGRIRIEIGSFSDIPTREAALERFQQIISRIPGARPPARDAGPYTTQNIRLTLRAIAFRAGVKGVHPHALRRAFASHMLQGGGNLRAIQDLLGHTNVSTTQKYTTLTADQLTEIHRKFHPHGGGSDDEKE